MVSRVEVGVDPVQRTETQSSAVPGHGEIGPAADKGRQAGRDSQGETYEVRSFLEAETTENISSFSKRLFGK